MVDRGERLPRPPRADPYRLLSALVDHIDELEAELAATRHRLEIIRTALATLAHDEYQPPGAQHVASVIERQLARVLRNDGSSDP